ncbi:hypothetical protein AB0O47_40010 [Streptomyces noursei]|uniref:hypothetical protein n=1 Tax=Streptomyces noursei TaxID=1971 RepID=UPI00344CC2FF
MEWGDNDTYGDPAPLCEELEKALLEHDVDAAVNAWNSYDLAIGLTGPGAVRLLHLIRTGTPPTPEQEAALTRQFVNGLD